MNPQPPTLPTSPALCLTSPGSGGLGAGVGLGPGGFFPPVPDFAEFVVDEDFWAMHEAIEGAAAAAAATGGAGGDGQGGSGGGGTTTGYDTFVLDPTTRQMQLQPPPLASHQPFSSSASSYGADDGSGSSEDESEDDSDEDDDEEEDHDGHGHASHPESGLPPFNLPPSILGNRFAMLRRSGRSSGSSGSFEDSMSVDSGPDAASSSASARGGRGRGRGRGGGGAGGGGGGGGGGSGGRRRTRGPMDEHQMTRRLRQKAESYERKKNRAKAGRKVLKERFDTLLRTCGDSSIRRSDKVGLLTRAIDLITGLRQQLGGRGGGTTVVGQTKGVAVASASSLGPFMPPPVPPPSPSTSHGHGTRSAGKRSGSRTKACGEQPGAGALRRSGRTAKAPPMQWIPVSLMQHEPPTSASRAYSSAKVRFAITTSLDPASLATCRTLNRQWRRLHSEDLSWREMCRRRWRLPQDDPTALEELRSILPPSASWREVYMLHHQARLAPRGPYALASPLRPPPACLAVGSASGVNVWLLLACRGSSSGGGTLADQAASTFLPIPGSDGAHLVSLRLLLQNATHDSVLVPFQRFRITLVDTAAAAAAAVRQARTISSLSTATSHATASSGSSNDGSEDEEDQRRHHHHHHHDEGEPPSFLEATATELERLGLASEAAAHQRAHLIACNDERLEGGARIPWECFEAVEGLRLGLFDTAVLSLPLLAPRDCRSATDFLSMAKEMVVKVLVPSTAPAKAHQAEAEDGEDKEKKPASAPAQQQQQEEVRVVLPIAASLPVMV